ncbi:MULTISPECIES: lipase family alpha/beta hydrolase [unclassified Corallococcus]|uniref:lipase family alpha/beta hydrolase n=1 Tax=unclassified Corallococcus TaxID=2685029 RepID=UPI001A8D9F82|nr:MULTISPECIES: alpha/beta hydrolase [unclassified Corallococcus]MBN9684834.1 alpha/beta hydrolase [Corallococcus sp. NCSPR001]WAS83701.1 alpha/beta hydrolase [Corallococcus sp. NCRR]
MNNRSQGTRKNADALRGASRLAVRATRGVMGLVEEMHRTIASGPSVLGRPLERPARAMTGLLYGTLLGVTRHVGEGLDAVLAGLSPWLGDGAPGPQREALLSALNGVLGDALEEEGNPLAIPMAFRVHGQPLCLEPEALRATLPEAGSRLLVLVHGSSMNDLQWNRRGHDHGAALARELGYTPVYLHYNSGLHISRNGRAFSGLLEQLVACWPVPLESLTLLGHSMGGLVARSACLAAETGGHGWRPLLRRLVCLGSPHHGSPLERGGSWVDVLLEISPYSAPFTRLGRIRGAGVTDLRFGNVLDAHWEGRERFGWGGDARRALALPEGVDCYAVAATTAKTLSRRPPGDGLVPVDSALGRHALPELTLRFPEANQRIIPGANHLDLLDHPEVYASLRTWLAC